MKKILGLDLGTNSIGWAVVNENSETHQLCGIDSAGSRIIPMDATIMGDFEKGNSVSQTKNRTDARGVRRLRERCLLRRDRLHRVLDVLNFLPSHYSNNIDKYGHFVKGSEPKIAWDNKNFLFLDSFNEMLADFAKHQPELVANNKKVPYDWTIYFLRKKALTHAITKEELAWILLNFNQKRGYYQLRDEDDDAKETQLVEFYSLKVIDVEDSGDKKGKDIWYNVKLENGWVYRRSSSIPLDWVGKTKDFIVTTELNDDGTIKVDKNGNERRSFRAPKEDDWTLLKKKTEHEIEGSKKTVGEYIYDALLKNPNQKIIGKLVRTIERKYYKSELISILNKQKEFIPELRNKDLYSACIENLYSSNDDYRNGIKMRDFTYLFVEDILFYQRYLKTKKSTISNCPFETRFDDKKKEFPIKCTVKSNPYFQEFRLLQFISNLRIYEREKLVNNVIKTDVDVTSEFISSEEVLTSLYEFLNERKEITQDVLLNSFFKIKKQKGQAQFPYRWNYVEDKAYPCNKTRAAILAKLSKEDKTRLTKDLEYSLWHLLVSVKTKSEIDAVFTEKKRERNTGVFHDLLTAGFSDESIENLKKVRFDEDDYASYSEKAIKKLLSIMRFGYFWNQSSIDKNTQNRISHIITGEYDEKIRERIREKTINLTSISDFKGLPLWLASYVVYNRHSESLDVQKWEQPSDIDKWLSEFKQHSLRNPIVEQVITETMRTVRDIWKQVGKIDEIHVELGREMKNPADKRKRMTSIITENENTNLRIKALLMEFLNPQYNIQNVRPYSPSQQEILRIYEEGALQELSNKDADFDFISKISKEAQPTPSDIIKYKCWLEQKYHSPYTGEPISLSRLFTSEYEIEHVIPQSRYFDDSLSNKVICESEVNKLKDKSLGFEFIKKHHGEKVTLNGGKIVTIFSESQYQDFVSTHYANNTLKKKKLLMDEIPDGFIERQMNDSRYISKYIKGILSNIVREKNENGELEQEAVSKNVISCNGSITDRLKKDWGMNDVWNRIIIDRFKRLNEITNSNVFTSINSSGEEIPTMPFELQKGFNKKRIDHRHHAMDAIVIACTTRNHVNLLNNEAAMSKNRQNWYALSKKLRATEKVVIKGEEKEVYREFLKPWGSFVTDSQKTLENIVVSFKQNLRVINKTVNKYEHYELVDGKKKKVLIKQEKGDSWAIRKSLHKKIVFGEVNLRFIKEVSLKEALKNPHKIVETDLKKKILELQKQNYNEKQILKYFKDNGDVWSETVGKVKVYYFTKETKDRYFASRTTLDTSFDKKKIEECVTDTGIKKILLAHLEENGNNPAVAFSPDGIDKMNKNIVRLNNGKFHQPIIKIRKYEKADKFAVGVWGNKSKKFVEAAKGTNLFLAIYESKENKKRSFVTVPLNLVIDCQKQYKTKWKKYLDIILKEKEYVSKEFSLSFILSPGDFVYLPQNEKICPERIYKLVDISGTIVNFIPSSIADVIFNINNKEQEKQFGKVKYKIQNEIGVGSQGSKNQKSFTGEMIKDVCIPILVDRLGNIIS